MKYLIAFIFGFLISYLSWSLNQPELVLISTLYFISYFNINKRSILIIVVLTYNFYSSLGLFTGAINFYQLGYLYAFLTWFGLSFLSSIAPILIWSKEFKTRLKLFPLMLLIIIASPLGFVTCVNPIISAAVLFPKLGFISIALYILTLYVFVFLVDKYTKNEYYKMTISITTIVTLSMVIMYAFPIKAKSLDHLDVINTEYEFRNNTVFDEYDRQKKLFNTVVKSKGKNILLPEHIMGTFTKANMMIWKELPRDVKVFAGASILIDGSNKYENALIEVSNKGYKVLYTQRVPVPLEMWKPWQKGGARAAIISKLSDINNNKVGVFICYEQFLVYPYFETFMRNPEYIIGISNLWWLKGSTLRIIQNNTMLLWANMFDVPYYYSVNL